MASRAKELGALLVGGLLITGCAALERPAARDARVANLSEESCPMDVPDTRVSMVTTAEGFALAFETTEADAVPALRDRVARYAATVEEEPSSERFTAQAPGALPDPTLDAPPRLTVAEDMDFEAGDARADTPHRLSGELVASDLEIPTETAGPLPPAEVSVERLPDGAQLVFEPEAESQRAQLGRQVAARAEQLEAGRCPVVQAPAAS